MYRYVKSYVRFCSYTYICTIITCLYQQRLLNFMFNIRVSGAIAFKHGPKKRAMAIYILTPYLPIFSIEKNRERGALSLSPKVPC